MRRRTWQVAFCGLSAAILLSDNGSQAATGIYTEAVNNYGGGGNLTNAIANCDGFRNTILQNTSFTASDRWVDGDVIDFDYIDRDRNSAGRDDEWFDRTGNATAISYFCGHGTSNNGIPAQNGHPWVYCFTPNPSATCNSPPSGYANPGFCRFQPPPIQPNGRGVCTYTTPRYVVVNGNVASFGNWANYSDGLAKFGESSNAGTWGGAGTNGGVNAVVLDLSNGVLPGLYYPHLRRAFAGVHVIMTLMPVTGDTAMINGRGAAFANRGIANSGSSVAYSWRDTISDLSSSQGSTCGYKSGDGGRGFNGCGCNVSMAVGNGSTDSQAHLDETWTQIRSDSRDTTAFTHWRAIWRCNYDSTGYPFARD